MLAKAPIATSLPYRRGHCNTRPRENSQSRRRCASRLACLTDKRLSVDARLVYPLLDDYAGWKGVGWPKQQTISHRLGIPLRRVHAAIRELAAVGWIVIERTGRANRYTLRWAADQIGRQCADRNSVYPVVMQQTGTPEPPEPPNTGTERPPEPVCPHCHGAGEREYRIPAGRDSRNRPVPERRWLGKCGCGT